MLKWSTHSYLYLAVRGEMGPLELGLIVGNGSHCPRPSSGTSLLNLLTFMRQLSTFWGSSLPPLSLRSHYCNFTPRTKLFCPPDERPEIEKVPLKSLTIHPSPQPAQVKVMRAEGRTTACDMHHIKLSSFGHLL